MTRFAAIVLLCLVLLTTTVTLAFGGGVQYLAAIGRTVFAWTLVLGPFIAVGAFVGRIAEGTYIRTQ